MLPFLFHSCRVGIWPHPWCCEHTLPLIPIKNRAWEEYWGDPGNIPCEECGSLEAADGHMPQGCHGVSDRPGSLPVRQARRGRVRRLLVRVVPPSPTALQGLWGEAWQGLAGELWLEQPSCLQPRVKHKGGGGSKHWLIQILPIFLKNYH